VSRYIEWRGTRYPFVDRVSHRELLQVLAILAREGIDVETTESPMYAVALTATKLRAAVKMTGEEPPSIDEILDSDVTDITLGEEEESPPVEPAAEEETGEPTTSLVVVEPEAPASATALAGQRL
jgi:hypothetical protein